MQIYATGVLTRDPQCIIARGGVEVTRARVRVTLPCRSTGDVDEEEFPLAAIDEAGDHLAQLAEGDQVEVLGTIQLVGMRPKCDGERRPLQIVAERVRPAGRSAC